MKNLAAFTHAGSNPGYVSINETDNHLVEITVRNTVNAHCNCPGTVANIVLTPAQYELFLMDAVRCAMGFSKDLYAEILKEIPNA